MGARATNLTIFLLFFGMSLLDAFRSQDWVRAALWLAIGLVFLFADRGERGPSAGAV
jgi:hypothetical protein